VKEKLMITNDNLRLFVMLEHGLEKVRILGAREFGDLAIMGVAKGREQLQHVFEAGDIDHYIICSGDPFIGNFKAEAFQKGPKSMVERLEKAIRESEKLPDYITVCSSTMRTNEGLEAIHEWFEASKQENAAASAGQ
jgi:hypothetical protein